MELVDRILDYRTALKPEDARGIATLNLHLRYHLRHRLQSSLEIYGGPPYPGNPSLGPFHVHHHEIPAFLDDVEEFHATFPIPATSGPKLSFGEFENVLIHVPFERPRLANRLRRVLSTLRRPIRQVKFKGWVDLMSVTMYTKYINLLAPGLATAETLSLVFNHAAMEEDDSDDGDEDEERETPVSCLDLLSLHILTSCSFD